MPNEKGVELRNGVLYRNGEVCRVEVRNDSIKIDCTIVYIDAIEWLLKEHNRRFPKIVQEVFIVQTGVCLNKGGA